MTRYTDAECREIVEGLMKLTASEGRSVEWVWPNSDFGSSDYLIEVHNIMPDEPTTLRFPGRSYLECVRSAVKAMEEKR